MHNTRHTDGSAGDVDYGKIGQGYANYRQPDTRIAALIVDTLGDARTVLNVGAGAGSYEPTDRAVTAVEPYSRRPAEVEEAYERAAAAGRVLMEAFMYRHHPQTAAVKALVDDGALGRQMFGQGLVDAFDQCIAVEEIAVGRGQLVRPHRTLQPEYAARAGRPAVDPGEPAPGILDPHLAAGEIGGVARAID